MEDLTEDEVREVVDCLCFCIDYEEENGNPEGADVYRAIVLKISKEGK